MSDTLGTEATLLRDRVLVSSRRASMNYRRFTTIRRILLCLALLYLIGVACRFAAIWPYYW